MRSILVSVALGLTGGVACSSDGAAQMASGGSGGDVASGGDTGSGGDGTAQGGADGSGTPTGSSSATGDGKHLTARIKMAHVPAGEEEHVCVVVALPNETATWATEVHATLGKGSHHLIVDRRDAGSPLQAVPERCTPTNADNATRLMIAQQEETAVTLPEGVAFKIASRQPLFLQLHYINTGTAPEDIEGTVTITLADGASPPPVEAHSIFTGQLSLNLPPHAATTASGFFVPSAPSGTRHVFAVTSHTHSLGVDSTIERVPTEKAAATTPIHQSLNWDEPPLTSFAPPLAFTGKDGLRLTCRYMNTTDRTVTFGTGFRDEMCFMWVYYFDR